MSTTTRTPTTLARENWRAVALALVVVSSAIGTLALVAATPSPEIPVGVSKATGASMLPTFSSTGLAVYADVGELEQGDVVVFYDEKTEKYTVHRVVEQTPQGYVTQGDNVAVTDQSIGRSYVTDETRVGEVYVHVDSSGVRFPAF